MHIEVMEGGMAILLIVLGGLAIVGALVVRARRKSREKIGGQDYLEW